MSTSTTARPRIGAVPSSVCDPQLYRYSHSPYDLERSTFVEYAPLRNSNTTAALPQGTLHGQLRGYVTFVPNTTPKPMTSLAPLLPTAGPSPPVMARAFIGQLPFDFSTAAIQWMCEVLAGCAVVGPQRIVRTVAGRRQATGGVHVFCSDEQLSVLQQNLHKRVLVDDTGLWFAATADEKVCLDSYVQHLHETPSARRRARPYDTVVVQRATSVYAERHPVAVAA